MFQYKLKRCSKKNVVNNVDRSSLGAPFPICLYKNKHIGTKHAEQQDITDIQNKLFLCVLDFSIFISYFRFIKMKEEKMFY